MNKVEVLEVLRKYKQENAKKYGIQSLGLFGSVAREQNTENSDVDICLTLEEPNPHFIVHIKLDLEERVHRKIDIVRVREFMNPQLKSRIEAESIYV